MRGLLIRFTGLILTLLVVSCAGHGGSRGSSDTIATAQVSSNPVQIFQAATDVMGRYSYSVSRVQYPTSAVFEKTGNSANRLADGAPAPLTLLVEPTGSHYRISLAGTAGTFRPDAVKAALEEIKAASH